ncbi:MAG: T9SS type A sorting domain-containing protein [Bacteroidetes bacterium]|nr:T9SS type A sorting domain-containing protein [Bacteroidota bacterium]
MTRLFYFLFLILIISTSFAQEVITDNIVSYTNIIINNIPTAEGTDDYVQPELADLEKFGESINLLIEKNYSEANTKAAEIGYKVFNVLDNSGSESNEYYVLRSNSGNLWGTFIINKYPKRKKLVIQIPHPKYDYNTGKQGIYVFKNTGAYAFFLSGTKRCNSSLLSDCSGSTTACNPEGEAYRQSDPAHNVLCTFQKATEVFESSLDSMVYFQFHGFTQGSSDPAIIMSNGNNKTPDGIDYLSLLRDELFSIDNSLTFVIAHEDVTWTKLTATTNTQGRLINGSSYPCYSYATKNSGRFIHLEQIRDGLRNYESDWLKMSTAIINIIPADLINSIDNCDALPTQFAISNYPNPFNASTVILYQIPYEASVSIKVFDLLGRQMATLVNGRKSSGNHEVIFDGGNISSGIYLYTFEVGDVIKTSKMILLK